MIKTKRLTLRPLCAGDLLTTHDYAGNADNAMYMLYLPNASLEETREFLRNAEAEWKKKSPAFYEFAILLSGRHIGAVSVYMSEDRTQAELGWIVHRDYWGKGIGTEAAEAAKEFALGKLHVKKLIAHCDSRNTGSYHVMEKLGMTLESDDGVRADKATGEPVKEYMYSLVVG